MILKTRRTLGEIFDILGDIAVSESGFVSQRSGFAAAWVVGVLVFGAVLFGTLDRAEAVVCGNYLLEDCTQSSCLEMCFDYEHPCVGQCVIGPHEEDICQCYLD